MTFLVLALALATAQHDMSQMPSMEHHQHEQQHDPAEELLMRQGSGTATNPAAVPMHMGLMTEAHGWMLMAHGNAFVSEIVQSGPRGRDALTSTNWAMGMATRKFGDGQLMLRSMLSLEPATVRDGGYPELFQTGETYHHFALVDRQHPHNFFMELAAEYALPLDHESVAYVYAAPVGDPALGPVAYPHRASALELPQATLTHHLQDSTHIANSVVTVGATRGEFGLAVSGFHGAEPGEDRWKIGSGSIDSWSMRATWDPTPNWSAQLSTGHLDHPEALEPGNIQRTTASVTYARDALAASLIWGHNHKDNVDTDGVTAEGVWTFDKVNIVTGRVEVVEKDELHVDRRPLTIRALTAGYTRDLWQLPHLRAGIGGNATLYVIPSVLELAYGSRPWGFYAFVRVRVE